MKYTKDALIIEDDSGTAELIGRSLKNEGWHNVVKKDGSSAMAYFYSNPPDLVILDLMTKGISGAEVCRKIRERSNIPIVVLNAQTNSGNCSDFFYIGVDDYIVKPFNTEEFIARVHAIYRRAVMYLDKSGINSSSYNNNEFLIDYHHMKVFACGKEVNLTNVEYRLVSLLSEAAGKILSRETLMYSIQSCRFPVDTRSIDVHIKNIRKKLEADPKHPKIILTFRGKGYKFGYEKDIWSQNIVV